MRYTWTAPEKTRLLIALVTETLARKSDTARYITSREWDGIADAYNRVAPEPVDNVKILQNRLAILRAQCREYHEVVLAARQQRDGELTDDAWDALEQQRPALRKWRLHRFEFYDDMAACLQLFGSEDELRDHSDDTLSVTAIDSHASATSNSNSSSTAAQVTTQSPHSEGDGNTGALMTTREATPPRSPATEAQPQPEPQPEPRDSIRSVAAAALSSVVPPSRPVRKRQVLLARLPQRRLPRVTRAPPYPIGRRVLVTAGEAPSSSRQRPPTTATRPSVYEQALAYVPLLGLSFEDRIDVKRFLVDERNACVFLHLDDDERRAYVKKYCLNRRDDARCYRFEPS